MKTKFLFLLPILFFLSIIPAASYTKIKIIAVDRELWQQIKIPETWVYKNCQGSFVEYPDFVEPTIHYCLNFIDENDEEIVLKFSRHKGSLDRYALKFNMTNFSETSIKIR